MEDLSLLLMSFSFLNRVFDTQLFSFSLSSLFLLYIMTTVILDGNESSCLLLHLTHGPVLSVV